MHDLEYFVGTWIADGEDPVTPHDARRARYSFARHLGPPPDSGRRSSRLDDVLDRAFEASLINSGAAEPTASPGTRKLKALL
jgi:hypothetical protein